jgi:RNA polymerase sigma factor (sigma-70 family)
MLSAVWSSCVWGVCRRCLRDPNDAEDALQATFIVLARKASSIARPERLSAWLHGVALRTARRVRQQALRRREKPLLILPTGEDEAAARAPELREVLDAELDQLPEKLRQAFVLCRIEGRTYAQAAQQLDLPLQTLVSRVARATELLRARLTRRGLAPAGTLASLLPLTEVGVPPAILNRVASGALGGPSAVATAVADAVIRGMGKASLWRYLVGAVLMVVGVGGGIALCRAPAALAPIAGRREAPAPPANPSAVLVWGQVLDAAGKPVSKARVALMSRPPATVNDPLPSDELVCKGESDNEGRYRLEGVPLSRRDVKLAAWADGHAVAAVGVPIPAQMRTVKQGIRLSRPREIEGRLGEPQPGQRAPAKGPTWRVEVIQIGSLRKSLRPVASRVGGPHGLVGAPQGEDLFWPKELGVEEGKPFTVRGLDPNLTVRVRVSGRNHQILELAAGEKPARAGEERDLQVERCPLEGDGRSGLLSFTHKMPKPPPAKGLVVYVKSDAGEVLNDAQVWFGPVEGGQWRELLGPKTPNSPKLLEVG